MEPHVPRHLSQDGKGPGRRAVLLAAVLTMSAAVPDLQPHPKHQVRGSDMPAPDDGAAGASSTVLHSGPDGDAPAPNTPAAA